MSHKNPVTTEATEGLTAGPAIGRWQLPRTFTALRHRNYRLFWFGQMVSLIGTWMQNVAQGWLVYQLSNSPLALGLVGFAGSLPVLLFSLLAGVAADRFPKRNLLLITQTSLMTSAFILSLLTWSGHVQAWHVALLAAFSGLANAFDAPTRQAFVVEMVGKEDLMNAIGLNSAMFNLARLVGPAVAGLLLAAVGPAGCFFLNGVSFLAVIASLTMMRLGPPLRLARQASVWANLREGLGYIRNNSVVLSLVSLVAVGSLFGMPFSGLLPVFARDILEVGPQGLGFLSSAMGAGALIGAISVASLGNFRRRGLLVTAGNLAFPAFIFLFSQSQFFPLSLLLLMGAGWAMISQNVTINTVLQTTVPDQLRGRVMSVHTLMFLGMMPLGNLQAGFVANLVGAPLALALGAMICASYALLILFRVPAVRRIE